MLETLNAANARELIRQALLNNKAVRVEVPTRQKMALGRVILLKQRARLTDRAKDDKNHFLAEQLENLEVKVYRETGIPDHDGCYFIEVAPKLGKTSVELDFQLETEEGSRKFKPIQEYFE